jgi:hypothetical protein
MGGFWGGHDWNLRQRPYFEPSSVAAEIGGKKYFFEQSVNGQKVGHIPIGNVGYVLRLRGRPGTMSRSSGENWRALNIRRGEPAQTGLFVCQRERRALAKGSADLPV